MNGAATGSGTSSSVGGGGGGERKRAKTEIKKQLRFEDDVLL